MDTFFTTITWLGSLYVLLPLCILLASFLLYWQKFTETIFLMISLVGTSLITHLLKILIARPRPAAENLLVTMPADFSFPSGHTSQITAFSLALCLLATREFTPVAVTTTWVLLPLVAVVVGYSRIYLQVHYISDVLVGGCLAILIVLLTAQYFGITVKN